MSYTTALLPIEAAKVRNGGGNGLPRIDKELLVMVQAASAVGQDSAH